MYVIILESIVSHIATMRNSHHGTSRLTVRSDLLTSVIDKSVKERVYLLFDVSLAGE